MSDMAVVLGIAVILVTLGSCLHVLFSLSRDMGGLRGEPDCPECRDQGCAECEGWE